MSLDKLDKLDTLASCRISTLTGAYHKQLLEMTVYRSTDLASAESLCKRAVRQGDRVGLVRTAAGVPGHRLFALGGHFSSHGLSEDYWNGPRLPRHVRSGRQSGFLKEALAIIFVRNILAWSRLLL